MKFGLDFDATYSADPVLWDHFIVHAKERGHSVCIVTARRDTEENREIVKVHGCLTVFTELQSKLRHCAERGLKIDVWIDDDPTALVQGH